MPKLQNIRAVGFDLDDTLVMTEQSAFNFENVVLAMMGRPPMSRQVHQKTWGRHILDAITERSPGVDVERFGKLFASEFEKMLKTNPIDNLTEEVEETLLALGTAGFYLFILTGRDGFETAHLTKDGHPISLHIAPEDVYHKDNISHPKPDPRAFDWLWAKGFKPNQCVFVGDSIYDGQAAAGAGMNFVATLESGFRSKEDFADIKVTAFINKFSDLTDLLI